MAQWVEAATDNIIIAAKEEFLKCSRYELWSKTI